MRAREFTINIPINVRIDGDNGPVISTGPQPVANTQANVKRLRVSKRAPLGQEKLATNFVPPLQQKIELMKNAAGKQSGVIDQLTADEDEPGS